MRINCLRLQSRKVRVRELKVPARQWGGWYQSADMSSSQTPGGSSEQPSWYLVRPRDKEMALLLHLCFPSQVPVQPGLLPDHGHRPDPAEGLTNLPHTDFTLCKCMIDQAHVSFPLHAGTGGRGGVRETDSQGRALEFGHRHRLPALVLAPGWPRLGQYRHRAHSLAGETRPLWSSQDLRCEGPEEAPELAWKPGNLPGGGSRCKMRN